MYYAQKSNKSLARQGSGTAFPLREWLCRPIFSTGFGSLCEFVSSQPQHLNTAGGVHIRKVFHHLCFS